MFVFLAAVVAAALVVGLSGNQSAAKGCDVNAATVKHTVVVKDGEVSDDNIVAQLCDELVIVNKDSTPRNIAFGVHDRHTSYDGVSERLLGKDNELTVTLVKAGKYHWHDHLHDEVEGYFTVTN